jgi:hypothetical protein
MPRLATGIQLASGVRPGLLRTLDALILGAVAVSLWGGVSLWRIHAHLGTVTPAGTEGSAGLAPARSPALEPAVAREAATLLYAGVLDAPAMSAALASVRGTVPPGIQIGGVEVRPASGPRRAEAVIAAEAGSTAAVARFLSELADHEAVLSTEVISETRQTSGAVLVRITAQLAVERD